MKALLIPEEGEPAVIEVSDGGPGFLPDLYAVIEADAVEAVSLTGQWSAWVDEEGIARRRPVNGPATRLARDYGMPLDLRGTVVLLGFDPAGGCSIALSDDQVEAAWRRLDVSGGGGR